MRRNSSGFTLVEVLVAVFIFSLVVGGAVNLLISAIKAQKTSYSNEQALREESYVAEYIGRALRMAQKELNQGYPSSACLALRGDNYNILYRNNFPEIRFLNHNGFCEEFFYSNMQIMDQVSIDATASGFNSFPSQAVPITSSSVSVNALNFYNVAGKIPGQNQSDNIQPRVTFSMNINNMYLETTVSQRNFDYVQ